MREVRRSSPGAGEIELWAEDEMRVGLKPVLRRVWAPRGRRPVARVRRRYEWAYVYGFVRPGTGEVFWLVMPTVNARAFSLALSRFAEWVGACEDKRVVLVLDRAGWHVAKDLKVPEGLHLEFLPARSPELQPAERLWPLVNERVANRPFEDLDELEGALVERCLALSERPDLLRGHTSYSWWPEAA